VRKKLQQVHDQRRTYTAIFVRKGLKSSYGYLKETVLLKDVTDIETEEVVTDHLWFNLTQGFYLCFLKPGDIVSFVARSQPYLKGYCHDYQTVDYKLSFPTKVTVVQRNVVLDLPETTEEEAA
jgi:hypothetical protein